MRKTADRRSADGVRMMMDEIIIATGNAHKVTEIREILEPYGITVRSAREFGGMPEVVEDGATFLENAGKKALAGARAFQKLVLADDSGLAVDALDGRPGIFSARYAGEPTDDRRNLEKVLKELEGVEDRRARFVCALVLASPEGILSSSQGEVRGTMDTAPRGEGGFGYDPAFIPEGYRKTFGELPAEVKNSMSHRGNALKNALAQGMFSEGLFFTWQELRSVTGGSWLIDPEISPLTGINAVQDDSRFVAPGALFVAIAGELADGHRYLRQAVEKGARAVCVQQEPAPEMLDWLRERRCPCLKVPDSLGAFQQLARAHRLKFPELHLLAVTGSCGKTSVKEMCAAVLEQHWRGRVVKTQGNTNNHYGVPRNLLRIAPATAAAVIEAGSNHPGEIAGLAGLILPKVAVVCNIGHAHLEFFGDLQGVAREKGDLLAALPPEGIAVYPAEAAGAEILRDKAAGRKIITFGASEKADIRGEYLGMNSRGTYDIRLTWKEPALYLEFSWTVPGAHQAVNAAAAAAAGMAFGMEPQEIVAGLQNTHLPGRRLELQEKNGVFWANDAYNANPDSMMAAFRWFREISAPASRRFLILGDMKELGECSAGMHRRILEEAVKYFPEDRIITVGPEMKKASGLLRLENLADAQAVRRVLAAELRKNDWVLLKGSNSMGLAALAE